MAIRLVLTLLLLEAAPETWEWPTRQPLPAAPFNWRAIKEWTL